MELGYRRSASHRSWHSRTKHLYSAAPRRPSKCDRHFACGLSERRQPRADSPVRQTNRPKDRSFGRWFHSRFQLARFFRCSRGTPASRCPSGCWMIWNRFDLGFIHSRFSALISSAGRYDPELSNLACCPARTSLNPVGINALVVGEVELRIYRTLGGEVRTLLGWISRTNDYKL